MKRYSFLLILCFAITTVLQSNDLNKGYYQIVSKLFHKGINIPQASMLPGEKLIVWDMNDCRFNQQWKFEQQGEFYIIRSRLNGMALSAGNEAAEQQKYTGNSSQLWQIETQGNDYLIKSSQSGKYLSVISKTGEGEELRHELKVQPGSLWTLEPAGLEYLKTDFNRILSPGEMKADMDYFFKKLHEIHVNPYAFVSRDSLKRRKKELYAMLDKPMKRYEFQLMASSLNGLFDGHTNINYSDHEYFKSYNNAYGGFFPYEIKYTGNKIFIKNDSLKGFEILSINNVETSFLCAGIEKRVNQEIRGARNFYVERNFKELLFLWFDIQPPFELNVQSPQSKTTRVFQVNGLYLINERGNSSPNPENYLFRNYSRDSIAIIEYNSCRINDRSKFNSYIDSAFRVIKNDGIKHLFIDLSRNGGGNSGNNDIFYSNINHHPKHWKEKRTTKLTLDSKFRMLGLEDLLEIDSDEVKMLKINDFVNKSNIPEKQKKMILRKRGLYSNVNRYCNDEVVNGFAGNLYVIQSPQTYSAATDMAAWFRYSKVGTIIGTENGGPTKVYIDAIGFYLPNSKIRFQVPYKLVSFPNGDLHHGILPDIDLGQDFYKDRYELDDLKAFIQKINHGKKI